MPTSERVAFLAHSLQYRRRGRPILPRSLWKGGTERYPLFLIAELRRRPDERQLFGDHAIGPFHERDKDRRIAKLRSPLIEISLYNRSRPAAGAAGVNGNALSNNLGEGLLKRRPADRHHGADERLAHQRDGLPQQEDLDRVPGFGEREPVEKRERRLRRVIEPHALFIMILRVLCAGSWLQAVRPRSGNVIICRRNKRR